MNESSFWPGPQGFSERGDNENKKVCKHLLSTKYVIGMTLIALYTFTHSVLTTTLWKVMQYSPFFR